jgi:hypothetical protein
MSFPPQAPHDRLAALFARADTVEEDDLTRHLRRKVGKWHRTAGWSYDELDKSIRKARIDILVDLVGHMKGHRLAVFARKPAPVAVTAWGEPTGTGLRTIDYLFADPILIPDNQRRLPGRASRRSAEFHRILVARSVTGPGSRCGSRARLRFRTAAA